MRGKPGGLKLSYVGIDLAGVASRPTGFCVLQEDLSFEAVLLYTDDEVVEATVKAQPKVVTIDAPLALPRGRRSLEEPGPPHLRECDRALLRKGIRFFPISLGPMRKLTGRGIRLRALLEERKLTVLESYPGAAQDILEIPRKGRDLEGLQRGLASLGVKGLFEHDFTSDELDAITCSLVGKYFCEGRYQALGDPDEILMILPIDR